MTRTRRRPANLLVPGDTVVHDDYRAIVLRGPYPAKDMFGRRMLGFWLRIVSGPDRVGDQGEHQFGEAGQAEVLVSETPE